MKNISRVPKVSLLSREAGNQIPPPLSQPTIHNPPFWGPKNPPACEAVFTEPVGSGANTFTNINLAP